MYFNRALMQSHQVTNNCEPQSQATMFTGSRSVGLAKSIEDKRQKLFSNSDTVISYRYADRSILARGSYPYFAAAWAELDGVTEQIPKDLLQPVLVAHYQNPGGFDRKCKANLFGFGDWTRRVKRRL